MSTTAVRSPEEYENAYEAYYAEAAEELRAVRVGEKETSEQAAIVARHADLFTEDQLGVLCAAEADASAVDERERVYRLRRTCEAGIVDAQLAAREDELENALLAARLTFDGDELPLRTAEAQLAVIPDYAKRNELGELTRALDSGFNERRRDLLVARDELEGVLAGEPDAVARNETEKQISLRELEHVLRQAADDAAAEYGRLRERWFERLLGPERDEVPGSAHVRWLRRLSPLESTYPRERSVEVCVETVRQLGFELEAIPNIRLDLEDRPQKNPRACVIAADPPEVVHLITRAQGGLSDLQSFLHEAGHALHYAGCDPRLPWAMKFHDEHYARSAAALDVPRALARPRADRDLLVHRRGRLPRAGLARAPLRPLRQRGAGERRGDALPRDPALPALRREAALRAGLLAHRCSPRLRASATTLAATSPTWTPASIPPTTCARGSARPSSTATSGARWGRTGGGAPPRERSCAGCSRRAHARRARTWRAGSASNRSTRAPWSPS